MSDMERSGSAVFVCENAQNKPCKKQHFCQISTKIKSG